MTFDRVIPGHGQTSDRAGIAQFRSFLAQLGEIGRDAGAAGLTVEETMATDALNADAGYRTIVFIVPLEMDRQFVLRRAWGEATGNFELAD